MKEKGRLGEPASGKTDGRNAGTAGRSGWVHRNLSAIAVAFTAFGVYAGALNHSLVWDDRLLAQVIESRIGQGGVAALLRSEFTLDLNSHLGYYRPVVLLSLWADSLLAPFFPYSHHLTNVLLHVLNSLLVLWFLRLVTGATWGPALGALLFAAHPVHAESVAFVSGRTDLFASAFVLLCAVAWARNRAGVATRPRLELGFGIAAFVLGTLSKEVAFLLPAVLLTWDLLDPGESSDALPGWWARNGAWILGWGAALALVFLLRWGIAGVGFNPQASESAPGMLPRTILEPTRIPSLFATYLRLLIIPWPLNAYYTLSHVRLTWVTVGGALAFLGLCASSAAKANRGAGLRGAAWILGFLLPVSGIVPFHGAVIAERFLYLPSVGLSILLCMALERLAENLLLRRSVGAAVLALTAVLGAATVARADVWRNDLTLFRDVVRTSPMFEGGYHNLGSAYMALGRYEEAAQLYRTAIRIRQDYSDAYNGLGSAYAYMGRSKEAMESFRQALRIRPEFADPYNNMGNVLLTLGRRDEAMESFRQALRIRPDHAAAYVGIGNAFRIDGDDRKAVEYYRHAIAIQPGYGMARYSLCLAYLSLGERSSAIAEYNALARLDIALAKELLRDIGRDKL